MNYKRFADLPAAFDYCREVDKPVKVVIIGNLAWKLYKLYPSGRADFIRVIKKFDIIKLPYNPALEGEL